jgi:putative resolvase
MEIEQKLYNIAKAAKILGVSTNAIRKWDNEGKMKVYRTPGGFRMIPIEEINRLLTNSNR